MGEGKLKLVYRNYYELETRGKKLKEMSENYCKRAENKALQALEQGKITQEDFNYYFTYFKGGNDAALEYIISGGQGQFGVIYAHSAVSDANNPFALSQHRFKPQEKHQNFTWIHTNRKREINTGNPRDEDTEFKLLNWLSNKINPTDRGEIHLYTYYEPCLSCDYVIIQFTRRYPKIKLFIYFSEEYKPKEGLI